VAAARPDSTPRADDVYQVYDSVVVGVSALADVADLDGAPLVLTGSGAAAAVELCRIRPVDTVVCRVAEVVRVGPTAGYSMEALRVGSP